jgi:hypothetical protein
LAPRELPRFAATMGPSDSPHAHAQRLLIPARMSQLPAGIRGLSVPGFIVRHAPFPLTPKSRTTALTRCFIVRTGFSLSDGLATLTGVTRLIWLHFRYGSHLRGLKCFAGRRYRRPRPSRYMSRQAITWWTPFIPRDKTGFTDAPDNTDKKERVREHVRGCRGRICRLGGLQVFHPLLFSVVCVPPW